MSDLTGLSTYGLNDYSPQPASSALPYFTLRRRLHYLCIFYNTFWNKICECKEQRPLQTVLSHTFRHCDEQSSKRCWLKLSI